jgi:GT2 family glycosyltransferase
MSGDDPYFELRDLPPVLRPGIYELRAKFPNGWQLLKWPAILFDRGDDYSAANRLPIFFQSDGRSKNVARAYFRLRSPVTGLRLDPGTSETFAVGDVSLKRVPKLLWRVRGFLSHQRRQLRSFGDLARGFGKAAGILAQGGWKRINQAFNEAAEMEASGGFRELPLVEFEARCQQDAADIRAQKNWTAKNFTVNKSALSIVVPVRGHDAKEIESFLRSLAAQSCKLFSLILVLDRTERELAEIIERCRTSIEALQIVQAKDRDAALQAASADFVMMLDPGDLLPDYFVEFFHRAVGELPESDIVYFDEALTDQSARRILSVVSTGAFDLRHYLSHPYIGRPIFSRALLQRVGGFESVEPGSAELLLRGLALAETIVHVPAIGLFMRRAAQVAERGRPEIENFLRTYCGWREFEVRPGAPFNSYEIKPPLPNNARVAIIILTKNGCEFLRCCLDSIFQRAKYNRTSCDIFVVDHESDDEQTLALLKTEQAAGRIRVLPYKGAWNFSAINNAATRAADAAGSYTHYCFMNNDIVLETEDWLDRLIAHFSYPDVGIVGARLHYPDGGIQHAGVVLGLGGPAGHAFQFCRERARMDRPPDYLGSLAATRDFSAVTAALMLVSKPLFQMLNGFDDSLAVGFNDTDFCLRAAERGSKSCYAGAVKAMHIEGASRGAAPHPQDTETFYQRYKNTIRDGDPHYGRFMNTASPDWWFTFEGMGTFRLQVTKTRQQRGSATADPAL